MTPLARINESAPRVALAFRLPSIAMLMLLTLGLNRACGQDLASAPSDPDRSGSTLAIYAVDELPVYRPGSDADEDFDPTMLVLYLKSAVDPDSWQQPGRSLLVNRPGKSLVIRQTSINHERIASILHRFQLFSRPISRELISESIRQAGRTNRRVLVAVASPASQLAETTLAYLENPEHSKVADNYVLHCTTAIHAEPLTGLLNIAEGESMSGLFVIDQDGSVVDRLGSESGPGLEKKVAELLGGAAVPLPSAAKLMAEGIDRADKTNRHVLVIVSGPGCVHCLQLKSVLDLLERELEKDYVMVQLDTRMSDLESVVQRYGRTDDEIPWYAMVDSHDMTIITSESKTGNIGFPADAADRKHFRKMFETTASRMNKRSMNFMFQAVGE